MNAFNARRRLTTVTIEDALKKVGLCLFHLSCSIILQGETIDNKALPRIRKDFAFLGPITAIYSLGPNRVRLDFQVPVLAINAWLQTNGMRYLGKRVSASLDRIEVRPNPEGRRTTYGPATEVNEGLGPLGEGLV